MRETILILGSADDDHARHALEQLKRCGEEVELLDSSMFPIDLNITFEPKNNQWWLRLPSGRRIGDPQIKSVYWRNYNGVAEPTLPDEEQAFIAWNDARSLFESFLRSAKVHWVNGWEAFQLHQCKPAALAIVSTLGVRVPATVVTNDADDLVEFAQQYPRAIFKPVQGGDQARPLLRSNLSPDALSSLRHAPITLQEEVLGTNIRVFVAGEHAMACEIQADELDYRESFAPKLLPHILPADIAAQSRLIAKRLHLLWTGIDYRLDPDGDYFFLEANPSPMFLGFERATGVPLTDRLLELLCKRGE